MRTLKIRHDTSEGWEKKNPVLREGEPAYELDRERFKIGNGFDRWMDLPYQSQGSGSSDLPEALQDHIVSPLPHPVYDDGPSLFLLYQNAKV